MRNPLCCRRLDSGDLLGQDQPGQVTYKGPIGASLVSLACIIMPENVPVMLALCSMLTRRRPIMLQHNLPKPTFKPTFGTNVLAVSTNANHAKQSLIQKESILQVKYKLV